MDPFFNQAKHYTRSTVAPLTLLVGALLGIYAFKTYGPMLADSTKPREIAARGPLTAPEDRLVKLFEETAPSVVYITTKQRGWYLRPQNVQEIQRGSGSGFIWDEMGHIVTNYHVIQDGNAFEVVLFDQSSFDAELVGSYPDKDLAVLRIKAPKDKLKAIPVGTNQDLKVGQSVLAIGNPFGLDHTLTTGVVSALDRTLDSFNRRKIQGAIQTDAAINPGNSGGPLLDSAGRLIGVNTQIYSPSGSSAGIGFAIPVDTVNEVVPLLIRDGRVSRPGLGIVGLRSNERVMRRLGIKGLMIAEVAPGSAADISGLRGIRYRRNGYPVAGDIIVGINEHKVGSLQELTAALDHYRVGDIVKVTVRREDRNITTEVQLQAIN